MTFLTQKAYILRATEIITKNASERITKAMLSSTLTCVPRHNTISAETSMTFHTFHWYILAHHVRVAYQRRSTSAVRTINLSKKIKNKYKFEEHLNKTFKKKTYSGLLQVGLELFLPPRLHFFLSQHPLCCDIRHGTCALVLRACDWELE